MKDGDPSKAVLATFSFSSYKVPELAEHWTRYINHIVYNVPLGGTCNGSGHNHQLTYSLEKPPYRRVHILINPYSGMKEGKNVWKQVKSLFKIANIDVECIETTHQGHAEEFAQTIPLEHIKDGIACISGDGLVSEVLNGFMKRTDWKEAMDIPVGIIPCGSGNGLAKSLNLGNPIYAAYAIIKWNTTKIDIFSIIANNQRRFGCLSIEWGLMAAIDFKSEVIRFAGKSRFTIWAVNEIIKKTSYQGDIYFYPQDAPPKEELLNTEELMTNEVIMNNQDLEIKEYPKIVDAGLDSQLNQNGLEKDPNQLTVDGPATNDLLNSNGLIQNLLNGPPLYYIPFEKASVNNWRGLSGQIAFALASNVSHISSSAKIAPFASCNDGFLDLVILRKASRTDLFKVLMGFDKGAHVDHNLVEYKKVKSFTLRANVADKDHLLLGVDGEMIESDYIQVEVHQSMMTVFTN